MNRQHGKTYRLTQQVVDRAWEVLREAGNVVIYARPQVAHHFFTRIVNEVWDMNNPPPVRESRVWPYGAERLVLETGGALTTASREIHLRGRSTDLLIQFEPTGYAHHVQQRGGEIIEIRQPVGE